MQIARAYIPLKRKVAEVCCGNKSKYIIMIKFSSLSFYTHILPRVAKQPTPSELINYNTLIINDLFVLPSVDMDTVKHVTDRHHYTTAPDWTPCPWPPAIPDHSVRIRH